MRTLAAARLAHLSSHEVRGRARVKGVIRDLTNQVLVEALLDAIHKSCYVEEQLHMKNVQPRQGGGYTVTIGQAMARHVSLSPWTICCLPLHYDCVMVPRRHDLVGQHLAHKSSCETDHSSPSTTSAPLERSADVQDLGMWQVWQEQSSSPREVPDLELPRTKTVRSKATATVDVVVASPTMRRVRSAVHVGKHVVGSSSNRVRAVAGLRLCRDLLKVRWRRRPRSCTPSSGSLRRSMSQAEREKLVLCWRTWTFPSQLSRRLRRGRGHKPDVAGQAGEAETGSSRTLGLQTTEDHAKGRPGGPREG